jgi:bacillithiol biosynthesis deacetylase BshB1
MSMDFMVLAAHADDAELGMGGTIAKMCQQGARGLVVDLTLATAATRGSPEGRLAEAQNSAQILGVDRINLGFKDAYLNTVIPEATEAVVRCIRQNQPRIVFLPLPRDYHPDHDATHQIGLDAWYKAGLAALWPELPRHRPERYLFYPGALIPSQAPAFLVDIDAFWETKRASLAAYGSQFFGTTPSGSEAGLETAISTPQFQADSEARFRQWGAQARCQWAEAFWSEHLPVLDSPLHLKGKVY